MDELAKLLSNLDRDGVTELVIGTNRPVTVREGGVYVALSRVEVTKAQLGGWLIGTPFEPLIPTGEGTSPPAEITVHGRRVKATLNRKGKDLVVRIMPGVPIAAAPIAPAPAPIAAVPDLPVLGRRSTKRNTKRPATKRATTPPESAGFDFELDGPAFELAAPAPNTVPIKPPQGAAATFAPVSKPAPVRPIMEIEFDPNAGSELEVESSGFELKAPSRAPPPAEARSAKPEARSVPTALASLVATARKTGASDLHVAANRPVMIRAIGELVALDPAILTPDQAEALLLPALGDAREQLATRGYVDLAIELPGVGRIRGNVSRQQGGYKGSFRLAFPRPPTLEELALPRELAKVVSHHQGLVVLAGPSGHGKTTTLAALVDLINETRAHHVLTIEDPVEIEHPRKKAVVSQREVGKHTKSFAAALKASLREDPDVIVIGELRDRESVEIALTAAETGHLVMATMSTPSAAKTIDRLIDMFPPDDQSQVRASLAGALRAIVAQRLLPRADGSGVVPAIELLTGVLPLAALIRNNQLFQLPNLMQRGRAFGMIRLDESLIELVRAGTIDEEVALRAAENKKEMLAILHPQAAIAAAPAKKPFGLGNMFGKREDR